MKRIMNDNDAIQLITILYSGGFNTEVENDHVLGLLEEYQTGVAAVLIKSSPLPPPEEVLRIAREKDKPIILYQTQRASPHHVY
jgi:hypothetical protein